MRFSKEDIILRRGVVSRMARGRIRVENSLAVVVWVSEVLVKLLVLTHEAQIFVTCHWWSVT